MTQLQTMQVLTSADTALNKQNSQTMIICKQCSSEFSCDSDANSGQCWCHYLPNVMPLTEEARTSEDCYCQKCLEKIISKKVAIKL